MQSKFSPYLVLLFSSVTVANAVAAIEGTKGIPTQVRLA
jgi:hypothetical protein